MAQQQHNYAPQSASQSLGDQQWSDNSGTVNNNYNNYNHYSGPVYNGYQHAQGSAAPYPGHYDGPGRQQWPVPDALVPGFPHMGHGVQQLQPHFGGTNVQTRMAHVCGFMKEFATAREQQILHTLCNDIVKRSNGMCDCSFVGDDVTRKSVNLFTDDEKKAKDKFWRRASKNQSQRNGRKTKKQQVAQAKQPEPNVQYPNAPNVHQDVNLPDRNAGDFVVMQMQQEAQQMPLPQDFSGLLRDIESQLDLQAVDPTLFEQDMHALDI